MWIDVYVYDPSRLTRTSGRTRAAPHGGGSVRRGSRSSEAALDDDACHGRWRRLPIFCMALVALLRTRCEAAVAAACVATDACCAASRAIAPARRSPSARRGLA